MFESTLLMRFFSLLMIFPRSGRIAWKPRSRPCFAEPPAESPSTMKSSRRLGIVDRAVGELARQRLLSSADLRRVTSRALRAAWRARDAAIALLDDLARVGRVLLEELGELRVDGRLDEAGDPRVAELRLRLALELRVLQLDRDHRREPLAHVLALEVLLLLLEQALVARVLVQRRA